MGRVMARHPDRQALAGPASIARDELSEITPASGGTPAVPLAAARRSPRRSVGEVRFVDPRPVEIVKATDLGYVQVLKHGNLYLLTDPFGDIHPDSRGLGLYFEDTRILSSSIVRVDGTRPTLLQADAGQNYQGTIQLTNPDLLRNPDDKISPSVSLARQSFGITRERVLSGGLEERLSIANFTEHPETVKIELDLDFDAADIFEVRGYPREGRGTLLPIALMDDRVTFSYVGLDGSLCRTFVAFSEPAEIGPTERAHRDGKRPSDDGNSGPVMIVPGHPPGVVRATWRWDLGPGERRDVSWIVWPNQSPGVRRPKADARLMAEQSADPSELFPPPPRIADDESAGAYRAWTSGTASVETDNELLDLTVRRSLADLRLLMNDGPSHGERYVAAGVPWFATLFGRDAILTAYQVAAFRPQLAIETLQVLAARQATEIDEWRDAEPGKIMHELRTGEMARAGELPHTPYYGSIDGTPLWLILLGETFDWTGDRELLDSLWPHALAALEWIDRYGDRDGDLFVEYERRSPRGLLNQGWKDSRDGIRDRYGKQAETPVALAEVQGYVYEAKLRMAGLARLRGEIPLADHLEAEAGALRERFESAFWIDDQAYYAMALDGEKRPVDAIASNAGQCLWTGIVSPERARLVAERLMAPGLFSGWGIRTYAAGQPGYNPIGYHTGTVWPHDTSLIVAGLKRYGFYEESNLLVGRMLEAAQHFPDFRLPELFCGFDRGGAAVPVPYPVACTPQAWAAGSVFLFLRAMLGLRPHAERRELELARPELPDWLGKVTVSNLRVGDATVDLLFHRWRGTTSAEVLRKTGDIAVTIRL